MQSECVNDLAVQKTFYTMDLIDLKENTLKVIINISMFSIDKCLEIYGLYSSSLTRCLEIVVGGYVVSPSGKTCHTHLDITLHSMA